MDRNSPEYKELSKERLNKILSKKITTAFIGAIAEFEKAFSHIWTQGPNKDKFRADWEQVRNTILSKGNAQIRGVHKELEQWEVKWERYNYIFKIGGKNEDQV